LHPKLQWATVKSCGIKSCWSIVQVALVVGALAHLSYSSDDSRNPKAYRNINAIGHRVIGYPVGVGNWYSLDTEKKMGAQASAAFEKSTPVLRDSPTDSYLDKLRQVIARNSDAQLPITIRVIDSGDSYALTFAGGYQYITRGLLLQLQNEGELAAAIARGVAHTALRSPTGLASRAALMKTAGIPVIGVDPPVQSTDPDLANTLGLLSFKRKDEFAADYFGIQYLYKSGYAPECFTSFIQKAWPPSARTVAQAFSSFPPLTKRLDALQKEINDILPKQDGAVTNTENFEAFRRHLLELPPPKPSPKQPVLIRSGAQELN
jgi:predicted Zn-dependent protease